MGIEGGKRSCTFATAANVQLRSCCVLLSRNSYYSQGAARAVDYLEGGGNHDCTSGRQLIEVDQAGDAKSACTVHVGVIGEGWIKAAGQAGVGAHGFYADSQDIPLSGQESRAGGVKTGGVCTILFDIEKCFALLALAPARVYEDPRSLWNAAIGGFPLLNAVNG